MNQLFYSFLIMLLSIGIAFARHPLGAVRDDSVPLIHTIVPMGGSGPYAAGNA